MPPGTSIRWGIVGCARIAKRGLIPGIGASKSGVLCGIASRDETVARAWAGEHGIARAYGSYEALLADSEIDAVYIPLPNELHKTWVLAAAGAGKHVLCEKPLALDARDAREMVDACQNAGVILMEAFMWRHQPRTKRIREMVRGGTSAGFDSFGLRFHSQSQPAIGGSIARGAEAASGTWAATV